jgi:hypothetical protein
MENKEVEVPRFRVQRSRLYNRKRLQNFYIFLDVPSEQRNQGFKFDEILLTFEPLEP